MGSAGGRHRRTMVSLLQTSKNEVIEMDGTMRERVARAINPWLWQSFDDRAARKEWTPEERAEEMAEALARPDSAFQASLDRADAVLDAMREPDEAMLAAVDDEDADPMVARGRAYSAWTAMIDAARTPAKES